MYRGVAAGLLQKDIAADWHETTPETIENFSAVAYYFGRKLYKDLDVPIGLINTSWGGTRIEPWTPPAGFASVPAPGIHIQRDSRGTRQLSCPTPRKK